MILNAVFEKRNGHRGRFQGSEDNIAFVLAAFFRNVVFDRVKVTAKHVGVGILN